MKTVSDLMVPFEEYPHVFAGDSLQDAVKAVVRALVGPREDPSRPRDRGVLVQAADGRVIGKLSMWDLLAGLEPGHEPPIDPFGAIADHFLWSQWLHDDLASRARSTKVEALLNKAPKYETIDEKAPLDLAVHRLIRGKHLSLLVTRGDNIIGILRLSDAFKAVNDMIGAPQPAPA